MALITCKECGHTVPDKAVACPKCGASIQASKYGTLPPEEIERRRRRRRMKAKIPLMLGGITMILIIIFWVFWFLADIHVLNISKQVANFLGFSSFIMLCLIALCMNYFPDKWSR